MQLFSIGLTRLNMDGSEALDSEDRPIENYGSDDLMSYSRVWTGLNWHPERANTDAMSSRVDPMKFEGTWHDYFPKSDLSGGYLGERNYPLCLDLPDHHFLRKGATYRLLGSRSRPELLSDPSNWERDPLIRRMELEDTSPLYQTLCAEKDGKCTYPGKIVLDENLIYDDAARNELAEYGVESLRSVKLQGGQEAIYYEYVRPPCVEQTFYDNAKKVEDYTRGKYSTENMVAQSSMCADPRSDGASGKLSSLVDSSIICVVLILLKFFWKSF
jgi:cullin-associated NEDD8-dissociated protein 1